MLQFYFVLKTPTLIIKFPFYKSLASSNTSMKQILKFEANVMKQTHTNAERTQLKAAQHPLQKLT